MGLPCVHCSSTKAAWPLGTPVVSSSAWPLQVLSPLMSQHWPQAPGPWRRGTWACPGGAALPAWRGGPVRDEGCQGVKNPPHQWGRDPDLVSNCLVGVRFRGQPNQSGKVWVERQTETCFSSGSWDPRWKPHGAGPQDLSPAHVDGQLLPVAPHGHPSVCIWTFISSSYTITSHLGSESPRTSLHRDHLSEGLVPDAASSEVLGSLSSPGRWLCCRFRQRCCSSYLSHLGVSSVYLIVVVQLLSHVWLFATLWTAAH